MSYLNTSSSENGEPIQLFFEQYGEGQPVILIHGWPLSHQMWEYQTQKIIDAGYQAIAYDRRGFGKSSKPYYGYDYDTLAKDLHDLINALELKDVILTGFSMGGGEVARYIGTYGTDKVAKAALVSSVVPFILKTPDNPDGVPEETFEGFKKNIKEDRLAFLKEFGETFVNYKDNKKKISEAQVHYNWSVAAAASPKATLDCIDSFGKTDFREDCKKFDIPTLIVHGDADQVVPIETAGQAAAKIIKDSNYQIIKDAPHGLVFTHTEEFNTIFLDFLKS